MELFEEKAAGGSSAGDCPAHAWSRGASLCARSLPKRSSCGRTRAGRRYEARDAGLNLLHPSAEQNKDVNK